MAYGIKVTSLRGTTKGKRVFAGNDGVPVSFPTKEKAQEMINRLFKNNEAAKKAGVKPRVAKLPPTAKIK